MRARAVPPEADDGLDARKAAILKAVVEEYVETAQPVGSQTIARAGMLDVSSATVRNEMTVLEREGYLVQPHTSAGRVPTDRGYRFFVDHFIEQGALPVSQRRAVSDFFASAHAALEDLLNETSQLLAHVSRHAAVVVGPQADTAHVRSVQLVLLQPRVVLAVCVLSNGSVEKNVAHLEEDVDEAQVAAASEAIDRQLRGAARPHSPSRVPRPIHGPTRSCGLPTARSSSARPRIPSRSSSAARVDWRQRGRRSRPPSVPPACSRCSSIRSSWCRSSASCSTAASR